MVERHLLVLRVRRAVGQRVERERAIRRRRSVRVPVPNHDVCRTEGSCRVSSARTSSRGRRPCPPKR